MTTTVDERGRVLIPKDLREAARLEPGQPVRMELEPDGTLRLRAVLEPREFLDGLLGCINEETRDPEAEPIDPLELKRIWEPRL